MNKYLLSLALVVLIWTSGNSQLVGTDAYMKGNYVEIGINGAGGFEGVDTVTSPLIAGYHFRSNSNFFGFVSNPQMDGWVNFDGDFYSPGSPENGWGIEIIDTTSTDTINIKLNNNMATSTNISGAITSYNYSAGVTSVVWQGSYTASGYDIGITIQYDLGDNDLYYTTTVNLVNNGPQNIEELYFFRNIDPDNNIVISSDYSTTNTIQSQASCCGYSCVTATQNLPWTSLFSFYSADTGAVVSYGGFTNRDGSDIYNGTATFTQTMGSTLYSDIAVQIAFKGENFISITRAPGNPYLEFSYKTVLGQAALIELMNSTAVNENEQMQVSIYPNPFANSFTVQSAEILKTIEVRDLFGRVVKAYIPNSTSTQMDLTEYPGGMYFVNLTGENSHSVKSVIKY